VNKSGRGINLMRALAHSLNARLEILNGQPGTIVRFEVPLADHAPQ